MNRTARLYTSLLLVLVLACIGLMVMQDRAPTGSEPLQVVDLLGDGEATGYRRADPAYRPEWPRDHGPHPDFRSEWWYFTGNLEGDAGDRFGFQLTFFRFALAPVAAPRASAWATRQIWMAHLALTDVAGRRFYSDERLARGAAGLAGAEAAPFRVWLEDWAATATGESLLPLRLAAGNAEFAIDLVLDPGYPPVLQGNNGYSAKGPEPGNASHYYSHTRMPVNGTVRTGARTSVVRGNAWLDREWSTSALGPDLEGWDWFALQLDDGRDLMYYRLRRRDGSSAPLSAGRLIAPSGRSTPLDASDVNLRARRYWESADTGVSYPVGWTLEVPEERLRLEVEPWLDGQEMDLSVRYWEGAMRVTGEQAGTSIGGVGYLEMTGYDR